MGTSNHSDAMCTPSNAAVVHIDLAAARLCVHCDSLLACEAVGEGAVVEGGVGALEHEEEAVV